jgi:hypothetical protein
MKDDFSGPISFIQAVSQRLNKGQFEHCPLEGEDAILLDGARVCKEL